MTNPFQVTKPVAPSEVIDREVEAGQLVELANEGNNARLVAPRRYGKTSVVKRVQAQLDKQGWLTVYVDLLGIVSLDDFGARIERAYSEVLVGPVARWFAGVRRSLSPKLWLGGGPVPVSAEVDLGARARDSLISRLALPATVSKKVEKRVHVAFDEFQELDTVTGQVDAIVRSEIQHHGDAASYVFAGSHVRMMEMMFSDRKRAFYGQTQPVTLRPLEDEPLAAYIGDRFESSGKEIIPPTLATLLDLVRGHPQRAMAAAHSLWDVTRRVADEERWEVAYTKLMDDVDDELRTLWDQLAPAERRALVGVSTGAGPFRRGEAGTRGSVAARAVKKLADLGVITKTGRRWSVVDPLLAEWARHGRTG